jgi:hypothetical protein
MRDRVTLSGNEEKVEVIISDSDDPGQAGMWSDDQHDEDDKTDDITYKSLSEVKWVPRLEADLEEILLESGFDFGKAASEF